MSVSWLTSGSLSWLKKKQKTLFKKTEDFPGGPVVKNPLANAGDMGLIPGLRRLHMPWGQPSPAPQLLKPRHTRAWALQQEKPPQ